MLEALIAGGGIGGLAAALSLAAAGSEVTVLERREQFTELGAGIQLGPNAFRALRILGLEEEVQRQAVFVDELRLMDGTTGRPLVRLAVKGGYRDQFGGPYAVVHRGELYAALLRACRNTRRIELLSGTEVTGYEQDEAGVSALTCAARPFRGSLLLGADGIRSSVRGQLVGDGPPRISGHTIQRALVDMDRVPHELRSNSVTLWAGPKWHFVHYPIAGGRQLNLAATRDTQACAEVVGARVTAAQVQREFAHAPAPVRALIDLGRDWRTWVLCDRDPVERWVEGRVALLGDAAHPMLQYAAQGACMALEDAVVLRRALDGCGDRVADALRAYNRARRARTHRTQLVSRQLGEHVYHAAGARARERNRLLRSFGTDELHERIAWIHGAYRFDEVA